MNVLGRTVLRLLGSTQSPVGSTVAMGMLISVTEKKSARHGVTRFETNRAITGMAHERYVSGEPIVGSRPPDELARRLFAHGGAAAVHVHGNQILVELADGRSADGMSEIITDLFTHYTPGVIPSYPPQ